MTDAEMDAEIRRSILIAGLPLPSFQADLLISLQKELADLRAQVAQLSEDEKPK